jgi:hypothetical protein
MVNQTVEQMWGAARLVLSPGHLIDKFLDWIEELSGASATAAAQGDRLMISEVRTEPLLDAVNT